MKLSILAVILTVAVGKHLAFSLEPPCQGSDILCGEEPYQWCKHIDPYARCSAKSFCPPVCPEGDHFFCPGGLDPEGCPMPDTCMPNVPGECQPTCPMVGKCGPDKKTCYGGNDSKGCILPETCVLNTADCPLRCMENEMYCVGGNDPAGNSLPDTCTPSLPDSPCHAFCPITCDRNEVYCPGGLDPNGCEYPGSCRWQDPSVVCRTGCPPACPPGEISCYMGIDAMGCEMAHVCSMNGECPEPQGTVPLFDWLDVHNKRF